jgi:hypothetical protein
LPRSCVSAVTLAPEMIWHPPCVWRLAMKQLESADYCMLAWLCAMIACLSDIVAVHFGAAQETVRTFALAGADLVGMAWAATGLRLRPAKQHKADRRE